MLSNTLLAFATVVLAVTAAPNKPASPNSYTCLCPAPTTSSLKSSSSTLAASSTSSHTASTSSKVRSTSTSHTSSTQQTSKTTSTTNQQTTSSTSTAASATATINNGQIFMNQCTNTGVSIADCTQLLNIAALNGNSISVGGGSSSVSSTPVNNGQEFLNQCNNSGISVLDCAQLLNIALLNGNMIDISLSAITSLLVGLGLPTSILSGLLPTGTGLVALPTGVL